MAKMGYSKSVASRLAAATALTGTLAACDGRSVGVVRRTQTEDSVRIVGACNDMPAAYMLCTVAVSASTDPEGFGRVPVEAQALGRPIIGTDHGGAQETILNGETGWLVPPNDSDGLAAALNEALNLTPHQRAVMGTRAMAHVADNFTREIMTEKTLDIYTELLELSRQNQPESSFKNAA